MQLLKNQSKLSPSALIFSAKVGGCSLATSLQLYWISYFVHSLAGYNCRGELSNAEQIIIVGLPWSNKD